MNTDKDKIYSTNREQIEALQVKISEKRKEFTDTLSDEDRAKFEAVDAAEKILTDAGIFFYLFPRLPNKKENFPNGRSVWQWNNLTTLVELDENAVPTENGTKDISEMNSGFINWVADFMLESGDSDIIKSLKTPEEFAEYIGSRVMNEAMAYRQNFMSFKAPSENNE
jgi:hypothetical protein